MPYKFDDTPINNKEHDKRVKLTEKDREDIREEYAAGGVSQRTLAKRYGVSRRLIQFAIYPERREMAKKQFAERQKDGRYYSKEKQRSYMRKHRDHKKQLYNKGLLKMNNKTIKPGVKVRVQGHVSDEDLIGWLDENDWPSLLVNCVDSESELLWSEDCPYAIRFDDVVVSKHK